jgi:glycosyltransferase involved in cell wall biosynthesis
VTLEAAASGLPLLVTRVSGVEQLLHDDANGWFIAQDADDIAGRLRTLEADPQRARTMAAAARRAAGDYSWERMTEGYLALYDELAART